MAGFKLNGAKALKSALSNALGVSEKEAKTIAGNFKTYATGMDGMTQEELNRATSSFTKGITNNDLSVLSGMEKQGVFKGTSLEGKYTQPTLDDIAASYRETIHQSVIDPARENLDQVAQSFSSAHSKLDNQIEAERIKEIRAGRAQRKLEQEAATEVDVPFDSDTATSKSIQRHNDKIKGRKYEGRDPNETQRRRNAEQEKNLDEQELDREYYLATDEGKRRRKSRKERREDAREADKAQREERLKNPPLKEANDTSLAEQIDNEISIRENFRKQGVDFEKQQKLKGRLKEKWKKTDNGYAVRENYEEKRSTGKITNNNRRRIEQGRDEAESRLKNWDSYEESQLDDFISKNPNATADDVSNFQKGLDIQKNRDQKIAEKRSADNARERAAREQRELYQAEKDYQKSGLAHTDLETGTRKQNVSNPPPPPPQEKQPDVPQREVNDGKNKTPGGDSGTKEQSGGSNRTQQQSGPKRGSLATGARNHVAQDIRNRKAILAQAKASGMSNEELNNNFSYLGSNLTSENIDQKMKEWAKNRAKSGPGIYDYFAGNPKAVGGTTAMLIGGGALATVMSNGGRRSNSDLYGA